MVLPVGSITTVPVKSAATSKINWTQLIGFGASLAAGFGLDLDPVTITKVVVGVQAVQSLATIIMRTWFTKSVISGSTS